jgi:hypothetical protein
VKNITISLPDDVYRQARVKAAEREFASGDFERRKRLQDEVIASIRTFRAGDRLSREEIHDRPVVR